MTGQLNSNAAVKTPHKDRPDYDRMTWIELLYRLSPYAGLLPRQIKEDEKDLEEYQAICSALSKQARQVRMSRYKYLEGELACLMDDLNQFDTEAEKMPVRKIGPITPFQWPGENQDLEEGLYLRLTVKQHGHESPIELVLDDKQVKELLTQLDEHRH